jgi:8-oxo-dGTP pyrophosphatase MutT (NUDIX family)
MYQGETALPTDPDDGWPAIALARRRVVGRVPFVIDGAAVGSVAAAHLDALRGHVVDQQVGLQVDDAQVQLRAPAQSRDAVLAALNTALHGQGLIRGWRNETVAIVDPDSGRLMARCERAAARFWGTLTVGAHATGWVAGPDGRPDRLWIAQRAFDKATDPGAFDNLVGGGVPHGQTPFEALVREGWEEAGLDTTVMGQARFGRVIQLLRDVPEGLQFERLHAFDLQLPADTLPSNQDGEVHGFQLLPVDSALALAAGKTMTVDASLVTLDFALRHQLLAPDRHAALLSRVAPLWAGASR